MSATVNPTVTYFHLLGSTQVGSERWYVRLYSVPDAAQQGLGDLWVTGMNLAPNRLDTHRYLLYLQNGLDETPTMFDSRLILQDGIGERHITVDGELLNGIPSFDNLKLTLAADPVFAPMLQAARELRTEVWCEIAIESPVQNLGAPVPGEMYWPRKKRSWFWGKLSGKDMTGGVSEQSYTLGAASYTARQLRVPHKTSIRLHDGKLELSFVHWIKVLGAQPAGYGGLVAGHAPPGTLLEQWLDLCLDTVDASVLNILSNDGGATPTSYTAPVLPGAFRYIRASTMLYLLTQQMSPTPLFAIADQRLNHLDGLGDTPQSVGEGNLVMDWAKLGDANATPLTLTNELAEIWIPARLPVFNSWQKIGGLWYAQMNYVPTPLFDPGSGTQAPNAMSLYSMKTLAEAVLRFPAEWGFKFGVEIPLFEELRSARRNLGEKNSYKYRMQDYWWPECTRWLFQNENWPTSKLFKLDPQSGTIEYSPAANWITECDYTMPTPDGYGPAQGKVAFGADLDLANAASVKSLFRFVAYQPATLLYDYAGVELYIGSVSTALIPAQSVTSPFIPPPAAYSDDWGRLQAYMMMMRWGSARAMVSFDNYRRELETLGESNGTAIRQSFGIGDIGDFPLLRTFTMDPGLLCDASGNPITFSISEITSQPGHDTKIKALEVVLEITGGGQPIDVNYVQSPPPPPPPPPNGGGGPPDPPTTFTITTS